MGCQQLRLFLGKLMEQTRCPKKKSSGLTSKFPLDWPNNTAKFPNSNSTLSKNSLVILKSPTLITSTLPAREDSFLKSVFATLLLPPDKNNSQAATTRTSQVKRDASIP